jgi:6-pyruvoyltetrahydropterin/6-carboxytetrahydropterin synthase
MYEISVDETFAAAHNLRNYHGKCEDLHGHNYKVRVTLAGKEVDETGLLYDFVHLKRVIQEVIRALDHKYLHELPPFDTLNPSAENIARHIYDRTATQLPKSANAAGISSVTVWETETSAATYRA